MHFPGPGDVNLDKALPPGTDTFRCLEAPSGHMAIPCSEFKVPIKRKGNEIALVAEQQAGGSPVAETGPSGSSASSSGEGLVAEPDYWKGNTRPCSECMEPMTYPVARVCPVPGCNAEYHRNCRKRHLSGDHDITDDDDSSMEVKFQ